MGYTGEAVKSGCFEGAVDEEGIVIFDVAKRC